MTGGRDRGLPPPRRRFGQHFLTDPRALDRIVESLAPTPADSVVEIGPGRGALTERLAGTCRRLLAVEIDRDLVRHLRERFGDDPSVEVIEGDALEVDWSHPAGPDFLLAGNLPYYITSPLLFRIVATPRPRRAVLLVQREVADRLTAAPGDNDYGALTVNVTVTTDVATVSRVSAGAFFPRPAVDSAIIRMTPRSDALLQSQEEEAFRRFVQAVFGMRRKQMLRVTRELSGSDARVGAELLERVGIHATARPETLSPAQFVALHRALSGR